MYKKYLCLAMASIVLASISLPLSANKFEENLDINLKLIAAVEHGDPTIVEALLKKGADIETVDGQGFTPLIHAARASNFSIVKLLLHRGASLNATTNFNDTALKWACFIGNLAIVKLLLHHQADIHIVDNNGDTALIDAASAGHAPIVELLLKQGSPIDHVNKYGETALSLARKKNHQKVVELLRLYDAKETEEETERESNTAENLLARLKLLPIPEEHKREIKRMILQLASGSLHSQERPTVQEYLDTVFSLPWEKREQELPNLDFAQKVLDEDHFGLNDVKEQILDILAIHAFSPNATLPIICLVGPPGVGKTSIAKAIAKALRRKFVRVSVGGVHDESEIRGFDRTYSGARPGRIVKALKQAKSLTPVMLIDELDKTSDGGHHGDPKAALLEVLDPEQNTAFRDRFLEIPLDLSGVLFVVTANKLDNIPSPLRNRMKIIQLSSYSPEEKLEIAEKHLVKDVLHDTGLAKHNVVIPRAVLSCIIKHYAGHEAGVRELKRALHQLAAKAARGILAKKPIAIDVDHLPEHLGNPHLKAEDLVSHESRVGFIYGLYASEEFGGGVVPIEALVVPRTTHEPILKVTGLMGDMAQESCQAALSFVRAHGKELGINDALFKDHAIHLHTSSWRVDGPSAGLATVAVIASAASGRKIRSDYTMTGEVNLDGDAMPIGGVKEKLNGAKNAGFKYIIFPEAHRRDVEALDEMTRNGITIIYVKHVNEVLKRVLV